MKVWSAIAIILLPCAALADGEEDKFALLSAIEANGCVVNDDNQDAVYSASGLDDRQVFAAVSALYDAGLAVLEPDGSMRLLTEACQ